MTGGGAWEAHWEEADGQRQIKLSTMDLDKSQAITLSQDEAAAMGAALLRLAGQLELLAAIDQEMKP